MQTKPNPTADAPALRRQAEERLSQQHLETDPARTEADTQRLVHELQVHQIELEMQNEEIQRAREELAASLDKYSDLYDFAPVGYVTLDPEGLVREANLTVASLLGIERSRLVERRFGLFVAAPEQPAFHTFLARVFASQRKESCEVSLLREGKSPVEARIEAVLAASGQECRAAVTDITERKRAEADRLILNKLESTGILAGGIAHDFNNLLTVILLNLELARTLLPRDDEFLSRRLATAEKAAVLAQNLTQQLLTFAEGGTPVRKPTALAGVIESSIQLALSGSPVRRELALADDLWPAEVDSGHIGQVLRNLVLNAREAMPRGGVVTLRADNAVLTAADHPTLAPGDYVRVSIADQGSGIAREVLARIFDPYFSTKQRGNAKGMGLGLTICHAIVQKHDGAITVESEAGVGTTFHLYLPAARHSIGSAPAGVTRTIARPGKILVMDDEAGMRDVVGATLRQMGHEVELVEDGQRAFEAYRQAKARGRSFDAVLLDLTVCSGVGGLEAIRALLHFDPAVKGIVMSGYAHDPVLVEPERHGFKGGLAKPFAIEKLRAMLAKVLGQETITCEQLSVTSNQ